VKFGVTTLVTDESIRPDVLGRALEERGFDALFVAEHSHIPVKRETPFPMGGELPARYFRSYDPFIALTAAAAVTRDLQLGTAVALMVQRDVIQTAKEVASLDAFSGGRFHFGVGVGWNREEMRNHGTDPATRGALLNEQLQALKAIWTEEEAEFHGKYVDFDPIFLWPKPAADPHPPVYIGGHSPAALRRLKDHGDAWLPNPVAEPGEIPAQLALLAEHAPGFPMTVSGLSGRRRDVLEGYREAEVERVTFRLDTGSEAETLSKLDRLAQLVEEYQ
jgi:probable F420-dependent oxidoreductase